MLGAQWLLPPIFFNVFLVAGWSVTAGEADSCFSYGLFHIKHFKPAHQATSGRSLRKLKRRIGRGAAPEASHTAQHTPARRCAPRGGGDTGVCDAAVSQVEQHLPRSGCRRLGFLISKMDSVVGILLIIFTFISGEIHSTYHFKVYSSAVRSISTLFCNRSAQCLHLAKPKLCNHETSPSPPHPRAWQPPCTFCFCEFNYLRSLL